MNKNIDNGSALVYIVRRHIADIIKKSVNLRLGQANLFILLNGKLFFKLCLFRFSLIDTLCQHFNRLSEFDAPPKIFNSRIRFLNCFL